MKRAIVGALALGLAGMAASARAETPPCCPSQGAAVAACPGSDAGNIYMDIHGSTVAEVAKQLGKMIGMEVRIQGPAFQPITMKLCAPTPEAALTQVAAVLNARWHPAIIFGAGSPSARPAGAAGAVTVSYRNAPAASVAFLTAARGGSVLIADQPLTGKISFEGKSVPADKVLDAVATVTHLQWKRAYVLQIGPDMLVSRRGENSDPATGGSILRTRPDSPLTHLHRSPTGVEGIAPAPGMIVKDPEVQAARLEREALRRQELGEWAGVFTQETPKDTKRAIRDLRIRVETTIQKLESYPPQNRHLAAGMWHARYLRMQEDYKHLTPDQQRQVQPVLDAMKYFANETE